MRTDSDTDADADGAGLAFMCAASVLDGMLAASLVLSLGWAWPARSARYGWASRPPTARVEIDTRQGLR